MKKTVLLTFAFALFLIQVHAQEVRIPEIGAEAPSFTAESTNGVIHFPADYGSHWKILFAHPKDFTPVCSSELLELGYQQESFADLNAELVVVSTDLLEQHRSWVKALEEVRYDGRAPVDIKFPLVADHSMKVARAYGMIHSSSSPSQNIRGVYFIDPDNTIRSIQFYPNEVGRNVDELKRTLLALQETYAQDNIVTPVNWQPGDDVMVPYLTAEEKSSLGSSDSEFYQPIWFLTFKKLN